MDKEEQDFHFMLKEYEMVYGKFEMHYNAVEKTFRLYLLIIGAFISLIGYMSKSNKSFSLDIWFLEGFSVSILLISSVIGLLIYFKIVEHRLLIIAYVKSLNLNRKWFSDNSKNKLEKYFYFPTGVENPSFYKKYRHFYWEALLLSIINGFFLSIFCINIFIKITALYNTHYQIVNLTGAIVLVIIFSWLQLLYYSIRGKNEEKIILNKFKGI